MDQSKFEKERDTSFQVILGNRDNFTAAEMRHAWLDLAAAIRRAEKARQDSGDALPERPANLQTF